MDKTCNNCACNKVCNHDLFGFENCGNFMPAEDVIKVVRCKDCKHLTDDGFCWQNIHAVVGYKMPSPNDYCSYGERKDGEEKLKLKSIKSANCRR